MRVRQILFPSDFSPASEAARRVAVDMAREAGATLHVVHVVPPVTDPSLPARQLTQLAQGIGEGISVTTALLNGCAGREIIRYAREKQIDLIVLGPTVEPASVAPSWAASRSPSCGWRRASCCRCPLPCSSRRPSQRP